MTADSGERRGCCSVVPLSCFFSVRNLYADENMRYNFVRSFVLGGGQI
jgi:hypothetical protein